MAGMTRRWFAVKADQYAAQFTAMGRQTALRRTSNFSHLISQGG